MADERPRAGQSSPDRDEPDSGGASDAEPSDYPRRATMRGMAAPTLHLGPLRMVPPPPDSSGSTTFQAVEDIRDARGPTAHPAPSKAAPPAAHTRQVPNPAHASTAPLAGRVTPSNNPAPAPYAVVDNEPTLFDPRPNTYPQERVAQARNPSQSTQLVWRPQPAPVQSALAVTPAPAPRYSQAPRRAPLDPRLVLLLEPDSPRAASFRLLRDNLVAKKAPRILVVSSGAAHEGKTTCAINLALALSERPGAKILLLEGNFFAPALGSIFNIDASTPPTARMNMPWLLPYRIAEIMRGFDVAALVQYPGNPAPVFNSRWFDMAIGHLAGAEYDHLVIDAAALDGSPAVTQIVAAAEGALLTVRAGSTTSRSYRRAAEQVPQGRALGAVMMDA